jgi:hypothetical protein
MSLDLKLLERRPMLVTEFLRCSYPSLERREDLGGDSMFVRHPLDHRQFERQRVRVIEGTTVREISHSDGIERRYDLAKECFHLE